MRTKQNSSSLRTMSNDDLKYLAEISFDETFGDIKSELEKLSNIVKRKIKGTSTQKDNQSIINFGYGHDYGEFFEPYHEKRYKKCLDVLKKEISDVKRKVNRVRLQWLIGTGVKSEIARREKKN